MTIQELINELLEHDPKTNLMIRAGKIFYHDIDMYLFKQSGSMHLVLAPGHKADISKVPS